MQAKRAAWGPAPAGHAYGVAVHAEYRSAVAYLVEIDATDPANPRLTRAFAAVDVGIPINPKGLEAQIQGALIDGWSVMIRASNHLDNGAIREGSYSDFLWARMNHTPLTIEVHVFPADPARAQPGGQGPGGAGELGLPPGVGGVRERLLARDRDAAEPLPDPRVPQLKEVDRCPCTT